MKDPERHYRCGLGLLTQGRYADAAVHFHAAMLAEQEAGAVRPQMRYRSYYSLSRSLSGRLRPEELKLCEQAAAADAFDPILQLNLGKVYLRAGKTTRALQAFRRGLSLDPENAELRTMLARTDRRARPVVGGLDRDHPLNRALGRWRVRIFGQQNGSARR